MTQISLSEDQKLQLLELSQSAAEALSRRVNLILAYDKGLPTMQAAKSAGISRGRARYWKRQFLSRGMDIFSNRVEDNLPQDLPQDSVTQFDEPQVTAENTILPGDNSQPDDYEIPFPQVLEAIGMQPSDTLADAGKKVWLYHFAIMLSHEQGTLLGVDTEELHDMRVATRRMRTAFDIFGEAFAPKLMAHFLKGLRGVGRSLGQVRDLDVILEKGEKYQASIKELNQGGMEPLLNSWREEISAKRIKLTKHLQSKNYQDFKSEFNQFVHSQPELMDINQSSHGTTSRVCDIVPVLIYNRYARLKAFDSLLSTATITQLHTLRIEFKKFRYTLEYFKEILGSSTNSLINEVKQYQDHLGELHDSDVACQLVSDFLQEWEANQSATPIPERVSPEQIVTYLASLHAQRFRLMSKFPELWNKFNRPEFRQKMAQAISVL